MSDITALMATMKAAAEKAIADEGPTWWSEKQLASDYGLSLHPADSAFIAVASHENVLALVEALEKAQQQNKMHKRAEFTFMNALGLIDGATRDDILPAINAIKYLLNNANDKIASLESRTVTVKLPPRVDSSNVPFTAHTWNCCLDAVEKCLAAAGIQVIEGEGQ